MGLSVITGQRNVADVDEIVVEYVFTMQQHKVS